eukprot:scaffold502_cov115-Isochrysis_galbana.AAC.20
MWMWRCAVRCGRGVDRKTVAVAQLQHCNCRLRIALLLIADCWQHRRKEGPEEGEPVRVRVCAMRRATQLQRALAT